MPEQGKSGFGKMLATSAVASGATMGGEVDFGRPQAYLVIKCIDCSNVGSGSTMSLMLGDAASDTMATMTELDDPGTAWSKTLPTSGSFRTVVRHAVGAQRVQPVLSVATDGPVVFSVLGTLQGRKEDNE